MIKARDKHGVVFTWEYLTGQLQFKTSIDNIHRPSVDKKMSDVRHYLLNQSLLASSYKEIIRDDGEY